MTTEQTIDLRRFLISVNIHKRQHLNNFNCLTTRGLAPNVALQELWLVKGNDHVAVVPTTAINITPAGFVTQLEVDLRYRYAITNIRR